MLVLNKTQRGPTKPDPSEGDGGKINWSVSNIKIANWLLHVNCYVMDDKEVYVHFVGLLITKFNVLCVHEVEVDELLGTSFNIFSSFTIFMARLILYKFSKALIYAKKSGYKFMCDRSLCSKNFPNHIDFQVVTIGYVIQQVLS